MEELILQYKELSLKYPELCFKYKDETNEFILAIVTNNGPVGFKVNEELFDSINVKNDKALKTFLPISFKTSFNNLSLKDVNRFIIDGNKLLYYFGNKENVIIPDNISIINSHCFDGNGKIKSVKGNNVEEIGYYAFKNNSNLEKIEFKKVISMGNLLRLPSLKEIIIGSSVESINIEDELNPDLKITIDDDTFIFDSNLENKFLKDASCENPEGDIISLSMISEDSKRYNFKKSERFDKYCKDIVGLCTFKKLFDSLQPEIKKVYQDYIFYVFKNFDFGGMCIAEDKVIVYDSDQIRNSFYHELGHALDFMFGLSGTLEFRKIYMTESRNIYNFFSDSQLILSTEYIYHILESEKEFFAECFNIYFKDKENLYKHCPDVYNYIENVIKELSANKIKVK